MPGADDKREATENEEATGAKEGTWGRKPKEEARGRTGGVIAKPGEAGGGREEGNEATEDGGTGEEGARDAREGRGAVKEEEEGKPGGAETEGKEKESEAKEGGNGAPREKLEREEPKSPNQFQYIPNSPHDARC